MDRISMQDFQDVRFAKVATDLQYLNQPMIRAAFTLPNFIRQRFAEHIKALPAS
jgi:spermidine synthase